MKPFKALLLTSLVLGACEKSNDVTQLHEESIAIAKYYGPRVDDMVKRRDAIYQRGRNVNVSLPDGTIRPDVAEVKKTVDEASDKLKEMRAIVTPVNGGKSALETKADELQKDGKLDELRKLNDESQDTLDEDWTIVNADLTSVEGWLWQYEQGHLNPASPAVAPPQPTPNTTGEAPPAAAPPEGAGSAAGSAAKGEDKKAGEKAPAKADEKKTPDNKAAEKAAGEKADKKAAPKGEPKAGAGSAAAPKAAAPKAGVGSAAK